MTWACSTQQGKKRLDAEVPRDHHRPCGRDWQTIVLRCLRGNKHRQSVTGVTPEIAVSEYFAGLFQEVVCL
jgi:hypothetical protein